MNLTIEMDMSLIHNIEDEAKPKLKISPIKPMVDDSSVVFSRIPKKHHPLRICL